MEKQSINSKPHLVVLVGGYYPSGSNPMGGILEKLTFELTKHYRVTILTVRQLGQHHLREYSHQGATVFAVSSLWHDWKDAQGKYSALKAALVKIYCKARALVSGGSSQDYYADMMYRRLEKLYKEDAFQCVLSLSFPFQLHVAARKFKCSHPWVGFVTYSTDTHSENIHSTRVPLKIFRDCVSWRRKKKEMQCYKKADYNFFSREIISTQERFLKPIAEKSDFIDYVMPCGNAELIPDDWNKDKINLLFAGRVGRPMRDPSYFAKIISLLPDDLNVVLHLYLIDGSSDFFTDDAVSSDKVMYHRPVSSREMLMLMNAADVLVNIGNNSDVFMPSKVFDYISTGRAIINVRYGTHELNPVLAKYPLLLDIVNYENAELDANRVAEFCKMSQGRKLARSEIDALYSRYTQGKIVEKLRGRIDEAIINSREYETKRR